MSARIRTGYAFRKAAGKIDDVLDRLVQCNFKRVPITDTASTFGWVKWQRAAYERELTPVFGVELAVSPDIHAKKPVVDYWTFLVRDSVVPLHGLIGVATTQFRYEPLLTIEQAAEAAETVNVIIGHRSPVERLRSRPGLWLGLGPAVSRGYLARASAAGHSGVALSDNRYPAEQDKGLYELVAGRYASDQSYPQWIMSDAEWRTAMCHIANDDLLDAALQRRNILLEQSTATLPKATMLSPERPMPLWRMCVFGAERVSIDLEIPVYSKRLAHELKLIEAKGFEDYFYLVADICQFARKTLMVGPARGSSCGSLTCYLLGITTVDPIKHDLLFERFIDANRDDLPDIDIDFSDQNRDAVFEYVRQKYGAHRVARLGTVNLFREDSIARAITAALDLPKWKIPPEMVQAMDGHPSHAGQHAAGVVITAGPVSDVVAVNAKTGSTMCDKYDAEALNLLKVDLLGLAQLSVFEDALQLASLSRDTLQGVRLDDVRALHILNLHRFAGVFQFNGPALQNLTKQVTVTKLDDIVALTALARPGPLDSGEAKRWIRIKIGLERPSYPHPLFETVLRPTLGVVIYQEQVMQIAREVGMPWSDVGALRRLISKSAGPEALERYHASFVSHGKDSGVPENILQDVWEILRASGAYSFNKSHAVAYAIVSYWCCWMKAYHPLEFAAASLSHAGETVQIKLLRELAEEGTSYVPADRKLSTDRWTVANRDGEKQLIGPLSNIIGIGPAAQSAILSQRSRPFEQLPEHVEKKLHKMQTKVDDLYPIRSAINRLMPDPAARSIVTKPTPIVKVQTNGTTSDVMVFGRIEAVKESEDKSIRMWIEDDTDKVFAMISKYDHAGLGKAIIERGPGYYALKGKIPHNFRMIRVEQFKFLGSGTETNAENNTVE